ncbi:MAG: outer membrane beta-barrel protein [Elusimicrobiota bacterium]
MADARNARRIAVTALLLCQCAAAARAQIPSMPVFDDGMRMIGLQLGAAQPTNTHGFREVAASGIGVNLLGLRYLNDWIAAGAEVGMSQFGKNERGKADAMNLGILARVNLCRRRSWTPYILGGIGYHTTNVAINADAPGFETACSPINGACGDEMSIKAKGTSITAGLGIEKFLFQGLSLSFESRLRQNRFSGTSVESLNLMLGVHVWLSPKG